MQFVYVGVSFVWHSDFEILLQFSENESFQETFFSLIHFAPEKEKNIKLYISFALERKQNSRIKNPKKQFPPVTLSSSSSLWTFLFFASWSSSSSSAKESHFHHHHHHFQLSVENFEKKKYFQKTAAASARINLEKDKISPHKFLIRAAANVTFIVMDSERWKDKHFHETM